MGETVSPSERVFSLFEPHTELIQRGKSFKPVEFGHMVMLSQTREKFISDYDAMKHRIPDPYLVPAAVEEHERIFGSPPKVLTADHGFNPQATVRAALEEKVETWRSPGNSPTGPRSSVRPGSGSGPGSRAASRS